MLDYSQIADVWGRHGVFDLLTERYKQEIEESWKWDELHAVLDVGEFIDNEWEVERFGDDPISIEFAGTVFALTPSGKYYLPFACSNVTPKEALKDEAWWEAFEAVLESHGLFHTSGEGDPCDVFFAKHLDSSSDDEEDDESPDPEVADDLIKVLFGFILPIIGHRTLWGRLISVCLAYGKGGK